MASVKHYMKAMLVAVKALEEVGIMHRDIKPSNFLYDKKTKTGLLIDFGLSELAYKEKDDMQKLFARDPSKAEIYRKLDQLLTQLQMKNRTGTKGYMPPESLFHHPQQTTAVDVWASGVIFLSLLAGRHPVFSLNNSAKIKNFTIQNLIPLTCIFGAKAVKEIGFKYGYGVLIP